ncbi:MAG: NAD(P)H-dependent oxidoreductase [Candidatus Marsarchaeota archaeon]|jgi:chromate reductase|nr:NAD(P)H-dependent oxidoreductase [Candidatus Marsarchaeota archaeon]
MANKIKILGIHGSLRKDSYNKIVLKTAMALLPENAEMEIFELDKIPIFNQDLENNPPEIVANFKKKIREADAILIATPEYNYSVPGVLKNAIDWASRPYPDNSWDGKPVAVMSASEGLLGGARAQYHLRQIFVYLNMHPINKPEVIIQNVKEKIYEGKLEDKHSIEKIRELLNALVDWTMKLQR